MAKKRKSEDDSEETRDKAKLPEGRRVVRKKQRKSGSSSRETLILKKREIMNDMFESEESGPVDVRGQIERLKKAKKEQKEAEATPMEDKWGSRQHRRKGSKWLLIATFGVVIPLLAFVIATSLSRKAGGQAGTRGSNALNLDEEEPQVIPIDITDPVVWFQENSVEAYEDAIDILEQINEGETARSTLSLMRDKGLTKERMILSGFEWDAKFRIFDPREIAWEYGASGDTGFMVLMGRDSLFRNFRAYFVKAGGGLRMDWAATTAWSEIPVEKLVEADPQLPVAIRGWVVKKPHFDTVANDLVSWYQILSPDKGDFVWAYTTTGSEADLAIKEALNYGMMVMQRIQEKRVTLMLRSGSRTKRDNEFELIEFVGNDWVQP